MTNAKRAALWGLTILRYIGAGVWVACGPDDPHARPAGGTAAQRRQWTRMQTRSLRRVP